MPRSSIQNPIIDRLAAVARKYNDHEAIALAALFAIWDAPAAKKPAEALRVAAHLYDLAGMPKPGVLNAADAVEAGYDISKLNPMLWETK